MARNIRRAEQESCRPRIPILACTANALETEAAVCLEAGMDDYLVKPLQLVNLAQRLDHWLPLPVQPCLIDPQRLTDITMGDKTMEASILADFQRINTDDAVQLREAVAAGDLADSRHFAHRISGACRMIGSIELAQAASEVETASGTADIRRVAEAMTRFELELEQLDRFIAVQWGDTGRSAAPAWPP
jgi:HPt (histidine-containing phosphotransfer) domain-containing protein